MRKCRLLVNNKAYILEFNYINNELKITVKDSNNKPVSKKDAKIIVNSFYDGYHEAKRALALSIHEKDNCPVKRYFDSDGIENYELFMKENDFDEMPPIVLNIPLLKIRNVLDISLNTISLVIAILIIATSMQKNLKEKNYDQAITYLEETVDDSFNEDYLLELLKQNPHLKEEYKEFLISSNFLRDLSITDMSREQKAIICYNLYNLNIKEFDQFDRILTGIEELKTGNLTKAFVDNTDFNRNEILVRDTEDESLPYLLPHEFAHTVQSNNAYPYIVESVAELIAHEYWSRPIYTYQDSIKRLYVLMKIIGPEPVWNAFFDSPKELEESIISILGEIDGKLLLEYLKNKPYESNYNEEQGEYENNLKIDILLKRMYEKKYNKPISEDELITAIYNLQPNGNLLLSIDDELIETPIYFFNTDRSEGLDYLTTLNNYDEESTPKKQKSLVK